MSINGVSQELATWPLIEFSLKSDRVVENHSEGAKNHSEETKFS